MAPQVPVQVTSVSPDVDGFLEASINLSPCFRFVLLLIFGTMCIVFCLMHKSLPKLHKKADSYVTTDTHFIGLHLTPFTNPQHSHRVALCYRFTFKAIQRFVNFKNAPIFKQ